MFSVSRNAGIQPEIIVSVFISTSDVRGRSTGSITGAGSFSALLNRFMVHPFKTSRTVFTAAFSQKMKGVLLTKNPQRRWAAIVKRFLQFKIIDKTLSRHLLLLDKN